MSLVCRLDLYFTLAWKGHNCQPHNVICLIKLSYTLANSCILKEIPSFALLSDICSRFALAYISSKKMITDKIDNYTTRMFLRKAFFSSDTYLLGIIFNTSLRVLCSAIPILYRYPRTRLNHSLSCQLSYIKSYNSL